MIINQHTDFKSDKVFKAARDHIRHYLLANTVIGISDSKTITKEFSGGGDSGDWDCDFTEEETELSHFFHYILNNHVYFDWYNNDGGGGDITWDLVEDVITINGYVNCMSHEDQPEQVL